jgi:hypothetical protein
MKTGLLTAALVLGFAAPQYASVSQFSFDPFTPFVTDRVDGPYTVGTLFSVGDSPVLVTALGIQVVNNGIGPVGIWDASGTTLLDSVTVVIVDPVVNGYRYDLLDTPLALAAGTNYLIGALVGGPNYEQFLDGGGMSAPFSVNSGFTILENTFVSSGTLAAPLTDGGGALGRWAAANALVTATPEPGTTFVTTPEPGTTFLMLTGVIGLSVFGFFCRVRPVYRRIREVTTMLR